MISDKQDFKMMNISVIIGGFTGILLMFASIYDPYWWTVFTFGVGFMMFKEMITAAFMSGGFGLL